MALSFDSTVYKVEGWISVTGVVAPGASSGGTVNDLAEQAAVAPFPPPSLAVGKDGRTKVVPVVPPSPLHLPTPGTVYTARPVRPLDWRSLGFGPTNSLKPQHKAKLYERVANGLDFQGGELRLTWVWVAEERAAKEKAEAERGSAATTLQSLARGRATRRKANRLKARRSAAIVVQSLCRSSRARGRAAAARAQRAGAVTLQSLARRVSAERLARNLRVTRASAIAFQARWRGYAARRVYPARLERYLAAVRLQRVARGRRGKRLAWRTGVERLARLARAKVERAEARVAGLRREALALKERDVRAAERKVQAHKVWAAKKRKESDERRAEERRVNAALELKGLEEKERREESIRVYRERSLARAKEKKRKCRRIARELERRADEGGPAAGDLILPRLAAALGKPLTDSVIELDLPTGGAPGSGLPAVPRKLKRRKGGNVKKGRGVATGGLAWKVPNVGIPDPGESRREAERVMLSLKRQCGIVISPKRARPGGGRKSRPKVGTARAPGHASDYLLSAVERDELRYLHASPVKPSDDWHE